MVEVKYKSQFELVGELWDIFVRIWEKIERVLTVPQWTDVDSLFIMLYSIHVECKLLWNIYYLYS